MRHEHRRAIPATLLTPFFAVLFALLVSPFRLSAQEASVLVRVSNADGPLPGASAELLLGDSAIRSALSDESGSLRWVGLESGRYRVRVEQLGYRLWLGESFTLAPGAVRVEEVELEPSPVELTGITVRVDRIQIQRENTEFSTTVENEAIELLPVAYDAKDLVALTPGARPEHVWGGANFQANSYRMDGLSANHPGLGGSLIEPSTSWIERVEVRGLGAGAEHGGFQGGQVNVVTKSGSNDFSAMLRTTFSGDALSGSNLTLSESESEVRSRYDLEGEIRGALLPDRLFYYLGGTVIDRSARFLNHVDFDGRYLSTLEDRTEEKIFGKLTWSRKLGDALELSGSWLGTNVENAGMTGYEGPGAASRYRAPTWFANLAWRRALGDRATLEAQVNHFNRDERSDPNGGLEAPGVRLFAPTPPFTAFGNAAFALRSASTSTSARLMTTLRLRTGDQSHLVKVGAEYTRGSFLNRRLRSGGMTWMPFFTEAFDAGDPSTWTSSQEGALPTEWGGEVRLDSDVMNAAAFVQGAFSLGRLVLTPGIRWGLWEGWMDSRSGGRFSAARDQAPDPRIGATLELMRDGTLVLKGHWGRYHQDMIAQMFDRAGGTEVFSDQETWYYRGEGMPDPRRPFTEAERDALAAQGLITREAVVSLNETGPVEGYRQPYVDQWLLGLEKQFGSSVKMEALFTHRSNHDMIGLVDRNRESNYTRFERVRIHMGGPTGAPLPFNGGSVYLRELYVPNRVVREYLRSCGTVAGCTPPAGLTYADTLGMTWDPDLVLTTAPGAEREFGQLQLTLEVSRPRWGGSFSAAWTALEGNLDNVSGYADPSEYGPGPYVRVNEGVNAYGNLPNFSDREVKISIWGRLPGDLRGGAFFTSRTGDHYAPQFRVTAQPSLYGYVANAEPYRGVCNSSMEDCELYKGDPLPIELLRPLEGNDLFIGPRGKPRLEGWANLDLRVERVFRMDRFDLGLGLDLFNAFGGKAVTQIQTLANNGTGGFYVFDDLSTPFRRLWAGKWFQAPLERVDPRMLRVGMTLYF